MANYIGADHAGYEVKKLLISNFPNLKFIDVGSFTNESVDYPKVAYELTNHLAEQDFGLLICGSGVGMSIAANRSIKVRAVLCTSVEMAQLAREHNDANILVIGARITSHEVIMGMVEVFFNTKFEAGRHKQRVDLLK